MARSSKLILSAIVIFGLGVRLYDFQIPDRPVFDESFFATFAADYSLNRPHFDIHPPLGKIIFSLPLFFTDKENRQTDFLEPTEAKNGFYKPTGSPYGNFPFSSLRLIGVFFSSLMILAVFWLVKNIANEKAGLWAAFLIAIESGFIGIGRLITLEAMMIFFGLAALAIFFSKIKKSEWLGGLFWGLAISVKLNAAIFLAPLIVARFLDKSRGEKKRFNRRLLIFFGAGLLTLGFFWIILNGILIPPEQWLAHYRIFLPDTISADFSEKISDLSAWLRPFVLLIGSSLIMVSFAINGYLTIGGAHPASSPWYFWLIGQKPINWGPEQNSFIINGFLQFLVLASLIWLIVKIIRTGTHWQEIKPEIILAGGYILSFLPFILANRPTFLYQYLPIYVLGLMLAGIAIEKKLAGLPPFRKKITAILIVAICLVSFAFTAPFIYS